MLLLAIPSVGKILYNISDSSDFVVFLLQTGFTLWHFKSLSKDLAPLINYLVDQKFALYICKSIQILSQCRSGTDYCCIFNEGKTFLL